MDFWLKWGGIAAVAIGACVLVWGLWVKMVANPYREEGRAELRPVIAALEVKVDELTGALDKQTAAVEEYRAASARRIAAATAARARAEAQVKVMATQIEKLLATPPEVPGNPCESACRLLDKELPR